MQTTSSPVTLVTVIDQKTIDQKSNDQEIDILKVLNECVIYINKYTHIVFCIGTSCDSKGLRSKLNALHEKLFSNILLQKEAIRLFFKKSIADSSLPNSKNTHNEINYAEKNERLLCFTLATLAYIEKMIQKLTHLMQLFPTADRIDLVVDLGFNETFVNAINTDDVVVTNEITNSKLSQIAENDIEMENLRNRLKLANSLKEEIEAMDINLVRYNIKSESNMFMKNVLENNPNIDPKEKAQIKTENIKHGVKVPIFKKIFNNRKKCMFTILLTIFLVIIIVSIVCGIYYGMYKKK